MSNTVRLVCFLFSVSGILSAFVPVALSQAVEQTPVHVDSNLVVLRAVVEDKKIMGKARPMKSNCAGRKNGRPLCN
jgi:hypothetical protein